MTINRTQYPKYNNIEHINFPKVEKVQLDNNTPVYVINGGTQDVLKLDIMVGGGAIYSSKRIVVPITSMMLNEGTNRMNAHEIASVFDYYGAYSQAMAEKDMAFCGLVSLNKHVEKTLPLFYEIISDSIFPEKELNILLERQKQRHLIDMEKTAFVARNVFYEKLLGTNHPYGKVIDIDDYSNTTQSELISFYKEHYIPGNFDLILSGKVTDDDIKLVNSYFGKSESEAKPRKSNPKIETLYKQEPYFVEKADAVQSSIRMGLVTVNKYHTDYHGMKILSTILGGYFGSRLMKNIREDKGYTYGVHSMQVSLQQVGFLAIATDVEVKNTQDAIVEIKKEMERLCNEKVSQEELGLVRNYMMGEMIQMFDGPFAISDTFKAVLQYDMGFEYFKKMKQTILTITPEQLQDLAIKYIDVDKLVTVVVGKY